MVVPSLCLEQRHVSQTSMWDLDAHLLFYLEFSTRYNLIFDPLCQVFVLWQISFLLRWEHLFVNLWKTVLVPEQTPSICQKNNFSVEYLFSACERTHYVFVSRNEPVSCNCLWSKLVPKISPWRDISGEIFEFSPWSVFAAFSMERILNSLHDEALHGENSRFSPWRGSAWMWIHGCPVLLRHFRIWTISHSDEKWLERQLPLVVYNDIIMTY